VVTRPPIGIRVSVLPLNPFRFRHFGHNYYYHHGTFYTARSGYYEVVNAPIGAVVNFLPDGCETYNRNGSVYYQYDGVYYKPIVGYDGNVTYEVVRG